MLVEIITQTVADGKIVKPGDVVEVKNGTGNILLSCGRAIKYEPAELLEPEPEQAAKESKPTRKSSTKKASNK